MGGEQQYFVIFIPQKGEKSPAYSFVNKETLDSFVAQKIVAKSYLVESGIHSKEEVVKLLEQYKSQK